MLSLSKLNVLPVMCLAGGGYFLIPNNTINYVNSLRFSSMDGVSLEEMIVMVHLCKSFVLIQYSYSKIEIRFRTKSLLILAIENLVSRAKWEASPAKLRLIKLWRRPSDHYWISVSVLTLGLSHNL